MIDHVLEGVVSCLFEDKWRKEAAYVKELRGKDLKSVLAGLTRVERTPGLPVAVWVIVVKAKAVLSGKDEKVFWDAVKEFQGVL